jgi:hypothetical protein
MNVTAAVAEKVLEYDSFKEILRHTGRQQIS